MTQNLEGTFQITHWAESPYQENDDGSKLSHAKINQTYSGAIEGISELQYLMSYQSPSSAVFVGHEKVTGKIAGKSGSFIFQHNGTFENGVAKSTFSIVSGSGIDGFADIEGKGSFESTENGQANYILTPTNA